MFSRFPFFSKKIFKTKLIIVKRFYSLFVGWERERKKTMETDWRFFPLSKGKLYTWTILIFRSVEHTIFADCFSFFSKLFRFPHFFTHSVLFSPIRITKDFPFSRLYAQYNKSTPEWVESWKLILPRLNFSVWNIKFSISRGLGLNYRALFRE